ncbi:TetR/AcrR family transcriptional regulator [Occultella glacieicola]|uniref:TetR/AcrR family transcriptional regulator n=1 Tax=Occultella glacieicola TaxID=2518684 RepID=A0ABY2EAD0_9MICO|nr:TetR/AcrR family transcriptional regulator [Occultella glacieicola]TDE98905.1 TetR/AcrR family transcriptional regulator [Occultella glacieicola]
MTRTRDADHPAQGVGALSRQAMIDGAIEILAADPSASLSEVARRLGVGRTSLYRHFSDRASLLARVQAEGARRIIAAHVAADLSAGTGLSALERLCEHLFELGPVLSLLFADNPLITDEALADPSVSVAAGGDTLPREPVTRTVRRGQSDGSIDPGLDPVWVELYLWMTLAAGHLYATQANSRRAGLDRVLEALGRTLGPPV